MRLKVTGALAAIGATCGGIAGAALTYFGNVISGYPIPPTAGIYALNAGVMAALGATTGPAMVWGMLRSVPLWRALVEPAAVAVGASVASMLLAPAWFPVLVPIAVVVSVVRLRGAYEEDDPGLEPSLDQAIVSDDEVAPGSLGSGAT